MKKKNKKLAGFLSLALTLSLASIPSLPARAAGKKTAESLLPSNRAEYTLASEMERAYVTGQLGASTTFVDAMPDFSGVDMQDFITYTEPRELDVPATPADAAADEADPESGEEVILYDAEKGYTSPAGDTYYDLPVNTITRRLGDVFCRIVNMGDFDSSVRDGYQADPTGAADSARAFQEALNMVCRDRDFLKDPAGWILIYVPAGTYKITGTVFMHERTWIYMEEGATLLRGNAESPMIMDEPRDEEGNHMERAQSGGYTRFSGICIQGGTWDGGNGTVTDGNSFSDFLILRHGRNLVVRDAVFRNCIGHMLNFSGDENILIENCAFNNMPDYTGTSTGYYAAGATEAQKRTIRQYTEAVHLDFMNDAGEAGDCSDGTPCRNVTVRNCSFADCQRGIGTHHVISSTAGSADFATGPGVGFTFSNNTFTGCKSEPYSLFSYENVVMADSHADTARFFAEAKDVYNILYLRDSLDQAEKQAVIVNQGERVAVSRFSAGENGGGEPMVYMEDVTTAAVEDSDFPSSVGTGISLKNTRNIYLYQNRISNTAGSMIRVDGSEDTTIRGNRLTGGKRYGIEYTGGSSGGILLGNVLKNLGYHGICIRGEASQLIQVQIYYNTIDICSGRGIILTDAAGDIRGNMIQNIADETNGTKGNIIHVERAGTLRIEDNYLRGASNVGIRCTNSSSLKIAGNVISETKAAAAGIQLGTCNGAVVTRNRIYKTANWTGIQIQSSTNVTVKDNRVVGSGNVYNPTDGTTGIASDNNLESWYYSDVKETHWSAEYLRFCHDFGELVVGSGGKFNPSGKEITRQDFALILYRVAGEPAVTADSGFSDVPPGKYYSTAVAWASSYGVVQGYADAAGNPTGVFGRRDNIKRYQLALMMYRMAGKMGYDTSVRGDLTVFPDLDQSFFLNDSMAEQRDALSWAVGMEIITGKSGKLARKDTATRQECATMIARFVQAYPEMSGSFLTYETP